MIGKKFNIPSGMRFNRLTAFEEAKYPDWIFKCDCGTTKKIKKSHVLGGRIQSCGCLRDEKAALRNIERTIHGMRNTRVYNSWHAMLLRCENKNATKFENYGGRGITVCESWKNFENFYADMGDRPEGKTLDRIDNNGNYCKENCKWSTPKEQASNRRERIFEKVRITFCCLECKKEVSVVPYVYRSRMKRNQGRLYCSRSCALSFRNRFI